MGERSPTMRRLLLVTFALAACKSNPPAPDRAVAEEAGAKPAASVSAIATADAAAADAGPPKKAGTEPNLLDLVPAKVAVSSAVANPRDFPEHLVDGQIDTAWNSRTGDLVGGFIAFRVPEDARVDRVEMTAGYDKKNASVDLFTANHRITKVVVSRNGNKLGEHALDPNVRGLQSIPIGGPGGDYEIKVLATEPGTKKEWKELVVSELRVIGAPGKARRGKSDELRVVVGSLDTEPSPFDPENTLTEHAAFADVAALCDDFLAKMRATRAQRQVELRAWMGDTFVIGTPSCVEVPAKLSFTGDATYKKVRAVRFEDGLRKHTSLVVETPKGVAVVPASWDLDDPLDPGCPSIVRPLGPPKRIRIENGHIVVLMTGSRGGFPDEDGGWVTLTADYAVWCKDAGAKLGCRSFDAQYLGSLEPPWAIDPQGKLHWQRPAGNVGN